MTKHLCGIGFDVLLSKLYKIMVNKFTFVGFMSGILRRSAPGS